jgi:hypothetical protein
MRTADEVIHDCAIFTPEQQSLAREPKPSHVPTPGYDCRHGGGTSIDYDSPATQWVIARCRMQRSARQWKA